MTTQVEADLSWKMQQLAIKTEIENESRAALLRRGGEVGPALIASKQGKGHSGTLEVQVSTNVYGMVPAKQYVYRYDISMRGNFEGRRGADFINLMTARGDTSIVMRRYQRGQAFTIFRQHYTSTVERVCFFYDQGAILFSDTKLDLERGTQHRGVYAFTDFDVELFRPAHTLEVTLRETQDADFEMSVDDLRASIDADLDQTNLQLVQFLDLLTSADAIMDSATWYSFNNSEMYLEDPRAHGFTEQDAPSYGHNRSHLEVGCRKSTRFVEGPGGRGYVHPAQVISLHKRDFYDECMLTERMQLHVMDMDHITSEDLGVLTEKLGGITVTCQYGRGQMFQIKGFSALRPHQHRFLREGRETNVTEYFLEVYGIRCNANLPLVLGMVRQSECYFPAELLKTSGYQRIPIQRNRSEFDSEMIKAMAVAPGKRFEQETRVKALLRLDQSETLAKGGTHLLQGRLVVPDARQLERPQLKFLDETQSPDGRTAVWDGGKYVRAKNLYRWSIASWSKGNDEIISERELSEFAQLLAHHSDSKGMQMLAPQKVESLSYTQGAIREYMSDALDNNVEFVIFVHPNATTGDEVHSEMKLWERHFEVKTEGLLIKTVRQALRESQPATITNILNKVNVKLGGLNYQLESEVLGERDLVIGIGASHPRPSDIETVNAVNGINGVNGVNGFNGVNGLNGFNGPRNGVRFRSKRFPPSVIGWSANISSSRDRYEFIGDFAIQECRRDEKPELIASIVKHCVERFHQTRGHYPQSVVIYRNAVAEGQWPSILKYEVPFIELELDNLGLAIEPILIVPNKLHRVRFYPSEIDTNNHSPDQNIMPGTVIDSTVVHPVHSEFYLCPHRALQGTAKTPRYTVLYNPGRRTLDELELLSHALAFGHQIVNSPTSLPTPVFVAEEYAKRGLNVFMEWYARGDVPQEYIDRMSLQEIEEVISYRSSREFADIRINA